MIQLIVLTLFYAGVAYLGVGLIGLAFLSLREEKHPWEPIPNRKTAIPGESGDDRGVRCRPEPFDKRN